MATNLQTQSYVFSVLAAGSNPSATGNVILDPTQPPPIASGGPSLAAGAEPALLAVIDVAMSEDGFRRTTRIRVPTYDSAATYTYQQDATSVAHPAAGATLPVMLAAWAAAINASAILAVAETVDSNGNGVVDELLVRQDVSVSPESVSVSATGMTAVLLTAVDAESATLEVLVRTRNSGTPVTADGLSVRRAGWRRYVAPGSSVPLSVALDRFGASLQLAVAPYESVYPYISGVAGVVGDSGVTPRVVVSVAPCILPGS